jgi:hypothetical protein
MKQGNACSQGATGRGKEILLDSLVRRSGCDDAKFVDLECPKACAERLMDARFMLDTRREGYGEIHASASDALDIYIY